MTFLDLTKQRCSTRTYRHDPVPREAIERCLEAARLAPSACNSQPWRFIVVCRPDLQARLAEAAFSGAYAMNRFAAAAPVLVAVVRQRSGYAARLGGFLRGMQYSLIDIGIACEHFVLQAAEEGLGTCWLGWFNEKRVKRVLDLPRRTRIDIMLSVGYPQEAAGGDRKRKDRTEMSEIKD